MNPDADTHDSNMWVFPLSAAEIEYTFLLPNCATTLFGLNTIVTPVSSQLYIYMGLEIKFSLP